MPHLKDFLFYELPRGKPRSITMMNLIDIIPPEGEQIKTTPCLPLF